MVLAGASHIVVVRCWLGLQPSEGPARLEVPDGALMLAGNREPSWADKGAATCGLSMLC